MLSFSSLLLRVDKDILSLETLFDEDLNHFMSYRQSPCGPVRKSLIIQTKNNDLDGNS
jgi:hypothetical protein